MTRQPLVRLLYDRAAAETLEFALMVAPLLMLIFGTIEFGRLLWTRQALEMAAIEGARCMGVPQPSCASGGTYSAASARTFIEGVASNWGVTLTDGDVVLSQPAASGACSGLSQVTVNYTFNTAVPGLLTMLAGGSALTGTACFPQQP